MVGHYVEVQDWTAAVSLVRTMAQQKLSIKYAGYALLLHLIKNNQYTISSSLMEELMATGQVPRLRRALALVAALRSLPPHASIPAVRPSGSFCLLWAFVS